MVRNSETMAVTPRAQASGRERLWFTLAALALVALGSGFWFANGARTFGELMLGAFSWCF